MKKASIYLLILCSFLFTFCSNKTSFKTKQFKDESGYSYETVTNDPFDARIYTLENGLKVYLTVNKDEPRIQTFIAVKAGSSIDPEETTGLAHYLEHMMFKGTDEIGTTDWTKEEVLLNQISDLYELHKNTSDPNQKKSIYKKIDSISALAATYAIPSEYDKLIQTIGGQSTNAYTSNERTVYMNDIPANQLENWLKIEKERFSKLVLRLFHTELETVYEEFNMSQDDDYSKVYDLLMSSLFPNHPYGTQTTIGKPEHLKNPSMVNIQNYWSTFYVPNNMAICMSGDLNFEATIKLVDATFGQFETKEVPVKQFPEAKELTENTTKEVVGPDAENVSIAFRFSGINSDDYKYVTLIDQILSNQTAGLIDLDLVQQQKVLYAGSYSDFMNQYGIHNFYAGLREGQSFDEVRDLLLAELNKIKTGDFDEWILEAAIKNIKLQKIQYREKNSRAHEFVEAFTSSIDWADYLASEQVLESISKEELIKFANEKYNNYVTIYKKTGKDTVSIKIEKPEITPINLNRADKSTFFTQIENNKVEALEPVWLDFENQISEKELIKGLKFNYIKNETNDLFYLYYVFEMGKNYNKKIPLAIEFLDYLGTNEYDAAEIRKEFYKLGVQMSVYSSDKRSYVYLSGLDESMEEAIKLFEHLINNAKPDQEAYNKYIEKILKDREDSKLDKYSILYSGVFSYSQFGKKSSFTDIYSAEELKIIDPFELTEIMKELGKYEHRIFYYGTKDEQVAEDILKTYHSIPENLNKLPEPTVYKELNFDTSKVYVIDYDMVQTWIFMMTKDEIFNKDLFSYATLYNEYFGRGLSSIVFQEIRESRALAYSAFSNFTLPGKVDESHFCFSYIATQADKLNDATTAMLELLNEMPKAEIQFNSSKQTVLQGYQTDRITKTNIFWTYIKNLDKGINYDFRKDIYKDVEEMSINEMDSFFNQHVKGKKYSIFVLGNKDNIDMASLAKLGKVEMLSLEDLFNY